jgi:hypothetical protein
MSVVAALLDPGAVGCWLEQGTRSGERGFAGGYRGGVFRKWPSSRRAISQRRSRESIMYPTWRTV